MTEVRETKLPGVGVRHDFTTGSGQQIGVLVHRDGRREVLVYDRDDPDACSTVLTLSHDDTRTLAELLGASQVTEEIHAAQLELDQQSIAWIPVAGGSEADGTTIAEGAYRSRTGATVVAVFRGPEQIPSPDPDFVLRGDDLLVAVGTSAALDALRAILGA